MASQKACGVDSWDRIPEVTTTAIIQWNYFDCAAGKVGWWGRWREQYYLPLVYLTLEITQTQSTKYHLSIHAGAKDLSLPQGTSSLC